MENKEFIKGIIGIALLFYSFYLNMSFPELRPESADMIELC